MVRSKLRLDHFYIDFLPTEFRALVPLASIFAGSTHNVVQAEGASWEGIYLSSESGAYFELLGRRQAAGIAVSPQYIQYHDASKIREEMPWLPWAPTGLMKWPDGQPWFEWETTTPVTKDHHPAVETWTMKYHLSHDPEKTKFHVRPSITRFRRLHLLIGESRFHEIHPACEWLPGRNFLGTENCVLEIPCRDGSYFTVEMEKAPGSGIELRELEMELRPDVFIEPHALSRYSLTQTGPLAYLRARS